MSFFEANPSKLLPSQSGRDSGQRVHSHHPQALESDLASASGASPESSQHYQDKRKAPLSLPLAAMHAAVDQKGLDVRGLDISSSSVADYFVIVSGTSERHVKGIADKVKQELEKIGERPNSMSGYEQGEWVLLDYGDLVVHVFFEPMRQYYGLDELWGKRGQAIDPDPDLEKHMRHLRTGIPW